MQAVKPDIVNILQREGVELRQKGRVLWSRCPLHEDKSPSFKVDPERQTFHCFGCGAGGDVIAFIQARRRCSFRQALQLLGMDDGRPFRPDPRQAIKRNAVKRFNIQCRDLSIFLARDLRALRNIVADIRTEEDLDLRAWAYHEIPHIEHKLDVLQYGTDEDRYHLRNEATTNGSAL